MEITVINNKLIENVNDYLRSGLYLFVIFFLCHRPLYSKDWLFSPSLNAGEVFTDNINLTNNKQSAFVTEVTPGIAITRNTNRVKLNLNYKLQNLFNANTEQNSLYHLLNFNSNFQLVNNSLFFDTRASNTQQNISNNVISNNNISGSLNRTNVTSYGFSPTWTPHFKGYANGNIRINYDEITTGNGVTADTTKTEEIINFASDKRLYKNLNWTVTHYNHDEQRTSNTGVKYQTSEAQIRFQINKKLNVFSLAGYSDNNYQTTGNSYRNGAYYTVGLQWIPTKRFNIEAGLGNNSYVTLNLMPLRNINWQTTFRHREIGTNLGNIWQTDFNYRTNHADVGINYLEDTTSSQGALLSQTYAAQNIFQQFSSPINYNLPTLSNEVYIRKRANAVFNYRSGKSVFTTKLYDERRAFQLSNLKEEVSGVLLSWNWRFTQTMNVFISPLWQHTSRYNSSDVRKDFAIGVSRAIPVKFDRNGGMNAILEYRHTNQESNLIENSFDENRLTANLLIAF
jgi:uncharacterized protein (PEP-CTERM system associated)